MRTTSHEINITLPSFGKGKRGLYGRDHRKNWGTAGKTDGETKTQKSGPTDRSSSSLGNQSECLNVTHNASAMSNMPDYITALAAGCFPVGFDTNRVGMHSSNAHWWLATHGLIDTTKYVLRVVDHGYTIEWDRELPQVPQDGRNPPARGHSKIILVENMLKKRVIRLANTSVDGVISGCLPAPRKPEASFAP